MFRCLAKPGCSRLRNNCVLRSRNFWDRNQQQRRQRATREEFSSCLILFWPRWFDGFGLDFLSIEAQFKNLEWVSKEEKEKKEANVSQKERTIVEKHTGSGGSVKWFPYEDQIFE
jgi:hypothetical protein